jgi:hypothetical protein
VLSTQNWLTLMDYSAKYRVSLSTLRRRIKAGEIEHKFADGKYLIKEGSLQDKDTGPETIAPPPPVKSQAQVQSGDRQGAMPVDPDRFWQTTQSLLNEIKKAYSLVLQQKEEQILQLKEEAADLKTLVRVLEDENNRLKSAQASFTSFDLGLEV